MVMRYTSTSLSTLLRGAAATVRLAGSAKPGTLHRVRAALRRALHSVSAPKQPLLEHTLPHIPGSGRAAARVHHLSHSTPSHPLGPCGGAFRTGGYRPAARTPRGAALPANVGLGSARTFATAPAVGSVPSAAGNVPVVLRAFLEVFDDDDKFPRPLPRGRRYIPYARDSHRSGPRAKQLRQRQRQRQQRRSSSASSIAEQLATYFPYRPTEAVVHLPPCPEDLVTPGMSATLALPLSPSLEAMLAPTPRTGYADAEVGVSILARLTAGVLPLHDAYASYASSRVIPLLARLEALGLLARHAWPSTKLVLVCDNGVPDILRIVFKDRSAGDVLALLGDQLDEGWFALTDEYRDDELFPHEEAAITEAEHWERARPASTVRINSLTSTLPPPSPAITLVMPTLDMSTPTLRYGEEEEEEPQWPESSRASFPPSSMASGESTPSVLDSWATSPSLSRSLSFLDNLDLNSFGSRSESDDGWSVTPSEDDVVIEAENGRFSAVDVGVAEVVVSWVGPGLSLIDSW